MLKTVVNIEHFKQVVRLQNGIATNVPELKIKLIIFEENFKIRLKLNPIKRGDSL